MTTKFTPGPWLSKGTIVVEKENRAGEWLVASMAVREDMEANARLIAAAPCLLDALCQWANAEKTNDAKEMENARAARDAAIAKATGEPT